LRLVCCPAFFHDYRTTGLPIEDVSGTGADYRWAKATRWVRLPDG